MHFWISKCAVVSLCNYTNKVEFLVHVLVNRDIETLPQSPVPVTYQHALRSIDNFDSLFPSLLIEEVLSARVQGPVLGNFGSGYSNRVILQLLQ